MPKTDPTVTLSLTVNGLYGPRSSALLTQARSALIGARKAARAAFDRHTSNSVAEKVQDSVEVRRCLRAFRAEIAKVRADSEGLLRDATVMEIAARRAKLTINLAASNVKYSYPLTGPGVALLNAATHRAGFCLKAIESPADILDPEEVLLSMVALAPIIRDNVVGSSLDLARAYYGAAMGLEDYIREIRAELGRLVLWASEEVGKFEAAASLIVEAELSYAPQAKGDA